MIFALFSSNLFNITTHINTLGSHFLCTTSYYRNIFGARVAFGFKLSTCQILSKSAQLFRSDKVTNIQKDRITFCTYNMSSDWMLLRVGILLWYPSVWSCYNWSRTIFNSNHLVRRSTSLNICSSFLKYHQGKTLILITELLPKDIQPKPFYNFKKLDAWTK